MPLAGASSNWSGATVSFIVIGLAAGVAMARGAAHLLSTVMFRVATTDTAIFGQVVVCVAAVSTFASAVSIAHRGSLILRVPHRE